MTRADTVTATDDTAVLLCSDAAQYVAEADKWMPGAPFPVLPGQQLDRYRRLFADGLPAAELAPRVGSVLSVGDEVSRAAGRLLAMATSRPHHHVPADRLLDELAIRRGKLVAVVGLANKFASIADWPGVSGALIGLVVARGAPALTCLVYRTLTVEYSGEDRVFIGSHLQFDGAADADAVEFDELAVLRERRMKVVVLRGPSRECSLHVLDSAICGRDGPLEATSVPAGLRTTPCLRGEGCFRTDLEDAKRLPAADLHATLVFMHGCSSVNIGINAFPLDISVSLGLLDGTAVAVIGTLGVHVAQVNVHEDLLSALADRLPLGEVITRLEAGSYPLRGGLVRFGLLGDPGLVLDVSVPSVPRNRPRSGRTQFDHSSLARLTHLERDVLPRLEMLRWIDAEVPEDDLVEIRSRIRAASGELSGPHAVALTTKLTADVTTLQIRMVERMTDRIYTIGWNHGGTAFGALQQVFQAEARCPSCGLWRASRLIMRHRIEERLHLQTLQCRRCGDVWWSTEPGEPTVQLLGPVDLTGSRTEGVKIPRTIVNSGSEELRGAVGYAFRSRRQHGLPPGETVACTVMPGETYEFATPVDFVGYAPRADAHATIFVGLLNGIYVSSVVWLQLT